MAVTPKFNIRRLEPGNRPRVDLDINDALDKIDQRGCSSLVSGLADERPTSGPVNGLYYYETDTQRFLRFNGSSWIVIHPAPVGSISGASVDTLSVRNFDFSSSLVWTPLAPILRWPWVVGSITPEWAKDHMGIVYFRGNLRVNYVAPPGDPDPPPQPPGNITETMFEFSSTAIGGVGPPDPHGALYDAFSHGQNYASMKIPTTRSGSHFYIRESWLEAVPGNPSRLIRGLAVYNYIHNQYVALEAITYST